jgi:hypothetical protein
VKDSFYEELEHVFDKFSTYHMNIFLWGFNVKVGREDICRIIRNESWREISTDNEVRVVNFATAQSKVQWALIVRFINLFRSLLLGKPTIKFTKF